MLGKHLFYLENKEKLHPFSSSAKEHSCLSLNCSPAYYQWNPKLLLGRGRKMFIFCWPKDYWFATTHEQESLCNVQYERHKNISDLYLCKYMFALIVSFAHAVLNLTLFFWNVCALPAMQGGSEGSVDRLCDLCDRLHGTLAEADMLGRHCKKRSGILRTLFRLIDLNYAQLNMHIAQLCLAVSHLWVCKVVCGGVCMSACLLLISVTKHPHYFIQKIMWILLYFSPQLCVSGNNLLNICKLIFQISRTESNDILFQNNSVIGQDGTVDNIVVIYSVTLVWNFVNKYDCMSYRCMNLHRDDNIKCFLCLDSLLRMLSNEHVSASGEAILYCVGTLKFLSGNTEILRILLDKNFICVAQKLIQKLCIVEETNLPIAGHILVQVPIKKHQIFVPYIFLLKTKMLNHISKKCTSLLTDADFSTIKCFG